MRMKFILQIFMVLLVSAFVLADDCSVFDGNLNETIDLNDSLNCEINDTQIISNAVLNCNGATISAGTTDTLTLGDNTKIGGCVFDGMRIQVGSNNVTIENNYWSDEIKSSNSYIYVSDWSSNITVRNNSWINVSLNDSSASLMEITNVDSLDVVGNVWDSSVQANCLNYAMVFSGSDILFEDNSFTNLNFNVSDECWPRIIQLYDADGLVFNENLFENLTSSHFVRVMDSAGAFADVEFVDNDFNNLDGFEGIFFIYNSTGNVSVASNRFNNNVLMGGSASVVWEFGVNLSIQNNNWTYHSGQVIQFGQHQPQGSTNGLVDNNRFEYVSVGDWQQIIASGNNKTGFTVTNNYFNEINVTNGALMGFWGVSDVLINLNEFYNVNILSSSQEQHQINCWSNCNVSGNIFENFTRDAYPSSNAWTALVGISDFNSEYNDGSYIGYNNITNVDLGIIKGNLCTNAVIEYNNMYNVSDYEGIFIVRTINANDFSGTIKNNYFEESAGVFLYPGQIVFENNYFKDFSYGNYELGVYSGNTILGNSVVIDNNTVELTRDCIDPGNTTGDFCFLGTVYGETITNNDLITNGYDVTWPMGLYFRDLAASEINGLVENNTGAFSVGVRLYKGSNLTATIKNNNFTWNSFNHDMFEEWSENYPLITLNEYQSGGVMNLTFVNNTYDVAHPKIYRSLVTLENDFVVFENNNVNVQDQLTFVDRYDDMYDYLTFQDNNFNGADVNLILMSGTSTVPSDFELFSEANSIYVDGTDVAWGNLMSGKTIDLNGFNLTSVVLTSSNTGIEISNAGLISKPVDNASNDWQGNGNTAYYIVPESASGDSVIPIELGSVPVYVNFTINSSENISDMQTYAANLSLISDNYVLVCGNTVVSANEVMYDCNGTFEYYYDAGNYDLDVVVEDKYGSRSGTFSGSLTYNELTATQKDRTYVSFSSSFIGLDNVSVDVPISILNTGNADITVAELTAYNIEGAVIPSKELLASYFRAGATLETSTILEDSVAKNITFTLNAGNESSLDFYLWLSAPSSVYPQSYVGITPWELVLS